MTGVALSWSTTDSSSTSSADPAGKQQQQQQQDTVFSPHAYQIYAYQESQGARTNSDRQLPTVKNWKQVCFFKAAL